MELLRRPPLAQIPVGRAFAWPALRPVLWKFGSVNHALVRRGAAFLFVAGLCEAGAGFTEPGYSTACA